MALFWRNIDAPDFGRAMEGYRGFTNTFGDAINNLDRGLARYDGAKDDAANTRLLAEFAGISDADAARARLATLTADPNFARYNAGTIGAVTGRPSQLLGEALTGLNLEAGKENLANSREDRTTDKRLGSLLPGYLTSPDQAAYLKSHEADFAGAGSRALMPFIGAGQDYVRNNEQILSSRQNRQFAGEEHQWRADDRQQQAGIDAATAEFRSYLDPIDGEAAIRKKYGAVIADKTLGQMGAYGGGGIGAGNTLSNVINGAGGGGGGTFTFGGKQQALAGALKATGLNDNVVAGLLGNFHIEGGYDGAQGDNGSAGGVAQWRNERRQNFTKLIGVDPTKASPEQTARFIKWELDNPKAAGMTVAQRDAILSGKSGPEVAALVDQFYERSDGKSRQARMAMAQQAANVLAGRTINRGLDSARSNLNQDNYVQGINQARNTNMGLPDAVAFVKKSGAFKGVNDDVIAREIQRIQAEGNSLDKAGNRGISNSVAAQMLVNSSDYSDYSLGTLTGLGNRLYAGLTGGRTVGDRSQISQKIKEYVSGKFDQRAQANDELDVVRQQRQQTEQMGAAAQASLTRAQQAARAGRRVNASQVLSDTAAVAAMTQEANRQAATRGVFNDSTVDPNARQAPVRSAPAQVRIPGPPAAGSLAALGGDTISQARAIRNMPQGANRIRLEDQFQRMNGGLSPSQAIVARYRQMGAEAQRAAIVGGIAGQQLREEFRKKYGMEPDRAIRIANTR